jgi:MerR family Zn(II)-responsive transcriptional regulator of zntA
MLHAHSSDPTHGLHVAQVAHRAGVTGETIRYYTRIGLLHPARDVHNGYRYYSDADVRLVEFIRKAQALGLTIKQIREIIGIAADGRRPCTRVKELVSTHLDEIRQQIAHLTTMEARLQETLRRWERRPLDRARGEAEYCPLIERCSTPPENRH